MIFFLFLGGIWTPLGFLLPLGLSVYCAYHAYTLLVERRLQLARAWLLPVCLAVLVYEGINVLPGIVVETRY
ncbi:MAG: hypothetical protein F6K11_19035 [Leptolyngbya sp. SIO3F4]|nr:hypothetical protein [Leptolyngbya sp. SIO3F4]